MKKRRMIALVSALILAFSALAFPVSSESAGAVIVAFGDSIAAAGKWESGFLSLSGESVINSGVGGDTSKDGIARFSPAVAAKKPDVVFIAFGTNDASIDMDRYVPIPAYQDNLRAAVAGVRKLGAVPIIVTPPPIVDPDYLTRHEAAPFESYGGPNGLLSRYADATRNVAAELSVTVADVNATFNSRDYKNLIADGVHPNDAGYRLYAETALAAYRFATRGDVNFDKQVGITDYAMVKRAVLGTYTLSDIQSPRADINGDGGVGITDYAMLKRAVLGTYVIDRGVPDSGEPVLPPDGFVVTAELIPDSQAQADMASNTRELQACVDAAHNAGGGTVVLPAGTFYFASQGVNARGWEEYVCMPKDNVLIIGHGRRTLLMPIGDTSGGLDMFYYNEYADSGFKRPVYLVNADFKSFDIDGGLAHAARYTSAGKGFMFNLFKDCDFDDIVCRNTDGTGFGVDCPINCTITNCEAYGCGKAGTTAVVGASGFGIGTGYADGESILIDNCYAEGNMKFGFFFEHQGRFGPSYYTATHLGECVVSNCTARNNYNDFGGELALDLVYRNCTVPADTTSVQAIAFRHHSIRCTLENMDVQVRFNDVTDKSVYYYEPIYWAVNHGITTGLGSGMFGIGGTLTKGQALTFLYRIAGMPGELILGNTGEAKFYEDSFRWAKKAGISDDTEEAMNDICSRTAFITYIWKYAGSPAVSGEYSPAVNWALSVGLMDTVVETNVLRRDAVTLLYRYFA